MAKTTSKSKTAYYAAYKSSNRCVANRKRKLERTIKKQPNNEQAKNALADARRRRKTPTNTMWKASQKRVAQLIKQFTGECPMAVFSSNEKVAQEALSLAGKNPKFEQRYKGIPDGKVDFSLSARAWKKGNN